MTNEITKKKTMPVSDSDLPVAKKKARPPHTPVQNAARDRRVTGYTRVKSGDLKRRSVTRTPDMSNPNARAMNPNVAIGSVPVSVPQDRKKVIPVAGVRVEPKVRTITNTQKVAFPYSIVFLALICSMLFFYMIFNYVQINEHTATVSDLQAEINTLLVEKDDLNAKLDLKNDLTLIEQIAREELGMVKLDEITKKYITMDHNDEITSFGKASDPSTSN
ncbi:MAG: septum formation initiator family protein [Ruminococcaceae bacterium]|nr:septum formation initiator family protein [Oscillospiraceae bacterium]